MVGRKRKRVPQYKTVGLVFFAARACRQLNCSWSGVVRDAMLGVRRAAVGALQAVGNDAVRPHHTETGVI